MGTKAKLCLVLHEIWTMTDPRDLRRVVELAQIAEEAGIHGVLIGEHPAMGPNGCYLGPPENPRDWIAAGNQEPDFPHPANLPMLSAIAAVTTTLELFAAAVLSTLRPPLLIAKELNTVDLISRGRLTFVPTSSWQREEYEAMGVDFSKRGKMLDEQLEIWQRLWDDGSPVSYDGAFYKFSDMYVEPAPYRAGGPRLWAGGKTFSPWLVRRTVNFADGLFPIVTPTEEQLAELAAAMKAAGRDIADLQKGAVLPIPKFAGPTSVLELDDVFANAPAIVARGFDTLFIKPSQFIDSTEHFGDFCRTALRKLDDAL